MNNPTRAISNWAQTKTIADAGELTARWLEGNLPAHPGYGPLDEETTDLIPALAALNRAGYVTIDSQPGEDSIVGHDDQEWWQRAAVDGMVADENVYNRLQHACETAGLWFISHRGIRWWGCDYTDAVPVTGAIGAAHTYYGARPSYREIRLTFGGHICREMRSAYQVTIIDPEWGRNDLLWPVLLAAVKEWGS